MSEGRDLNVAVETEPIQFASSQQLIGVLDADCKVTSLKTVHGVTWIIGGQYVSREILGLPQEPEERKRLIADLRDAFEAHVPVAEVRLAGDGVTESVYVVANRYSDRAPWSLRTY